jgi:hypothetical protein
MVANQVESVSTKTLAKAKEIMVQLELSEDGKNLKNLVEWDESLRDVFTGGNLLFYLQPHAGIEVDRSENARIMIQQRIDGNKTGNAKKVKKEASKAKKEQDEEKELALKAEEQLERRKAKMLEAMTKDNALAEKRGTRPVTYFAEYLSGECGG